MVQHKRTSVLAQRHLQFKLIGIFFAISCLAALLQVALMAQSFLSIAHNMPVGADQVREALPRLLMINFGWTVVLLVPFTLLVGMNLTNRVAGPAYGIHKYLTELTETGKVSRPCTVRDGDELGALANAVNSAMARIEQDNTQTASANQ